LNHLDLLFPFFFPDLDFPDAFLVLLDRLEIYPTSSG
jgi:hypothetical protein